MTEPTSGNEEVKEKKDEIPEELLKDYGIIMRRQQISTIKSKIKSLEKLIETVKAEKEAKRKEKEEAGEAPHFIPDVTEVTVWEQELEDLKAKLAEKTPVTQEESDRIDLKYKPRPDKDEHKLRKIAREICEGKIFTSEQIRDSSTSIQSVFMPLVFMGVRQHVESIINNVQVLYEYIDKAGPRSINGYPNFFSFNTLTKTEWANVIEYIREYRKMVEKFDGKDVKDRNRDNF